jgi:hypothetical protein
MRLGHTYFPVNFPFLVGPHATSAAVSCVSLGGPIAAPFDEHEQCDERETPDAQIRRPSTSQI